MKADGYSPTLVVETSPCNFQAWLNHGEILPQRLSTLAARALAKKFGGDKGAADWRHFGRLAGFTNRKAKYRSIDGSYPFVRVEEKAPDMSYAVASDFVARLKSAFCADRRSVEIATSRPDGETLLTIDDFRSNPTYDGDGNRIDLAYSVYMRCPMESTRRGLPK